MLFTSGKLVITVSYDYATSSQKDTITVIDGTNYSFIKNLDGGFISRRIKLSDGKFYLMNSYSTQEWDSNLQGVIRYISNSANYTNLDLFDIVADNSLLWIADKINGLVKYTNDLNLQFIVPWPALWLFKFAFP